MDESISAKEDLLRFFDWFWHDTVGFVYLPVMQISPDEKVSPSKWLRAMFHWPKQREAVVKHVLRYAADPDVNVFFAPGMFKTTSPKKESVKGSWVLWMDLDGNAPAVWPEDSVVPEPDMIVQSSIEGHQHAYWGLRDFLDNVEILEDRNRAMALAMQADTSGWDADQILRPIHTVNRKRNVPVTMLVYPEGF